MRIGVVAPSCPIERNTAEQVLALAASHFPALDIVFHPQCFLSDGHFAGPDAARARAFVDFANDPTFDALWFARGGYGSCRIAEEVIAELTARARAKTYLGYSDAGFLFAGLYRAGFEGVVHGPLVNDVLREGGEAAVLRALSWLVSRDERALEPLLRPGMKAAAFNLTVLSQLLGTSLEPDLADHVLMIEEVSEHMYRIDRALFHVTNNQSIRRVAALALGRCGMIPANDPDFGAKEDELARFWCARSGIPYLGRADIGHDVANRVVPFGIQRSQGAIRS
jgi:muramoyltetrapeptide carboxypeptidase